MPISQFAKDKAREFIIDVFSQADRTIRTDVGSGIRSLVITPSSFVYSGVFEDINALRLMHIGNYQVISEQDMDILASSFFAERSEGTLSFTNIHVYTTNVEAFTVRTAPYFQSIGGATYVPLEEIDITVEDYLADEDGELYISIPVASREAGAGSRAGAGDIRIFQGFPVDVRRVTNPDPTEGGLTRDNNFTFFGKLQLSINDGSLSQAGGLTDYILSNYGDVFDVDIVDAGNPAMMRDEVWLDSEGMPNLDREGRPYATHTTIGSIDFEANTGRGTVTSGEDISGLVGKRIEIPGDTEKFRLIRKVSGNQILISGSLPNVASPVSNSIVYGDGPHIGNMCDVYNYLPNLEIRSTVIDNSYGLNFSSAAGTEVSFTIPAGSDFVSVPSGGVLMFAEGTEDEKSFYPSGVSSADGTITFTIDGYDTADNPDVGELVRYYDMGEISISPTGDISLLPVIYILRVEKINPLSRLLDVEIPESDPGSNSNPGWYIKNTDPSQVLSAKEEKALVIDDKRGDEAFRQLNIPNATITDTSRDGGTDVISILGEDFTDMEGRSVSVTVPEQTLARPSAGTVGDHTSPVICNYVGVEGDTEILSVVGLGAEWFLGEYNGGNNAEGQSNVTVYTYLDDGPPHTLLGTYTDVSARGDYLVLHNGNWPAGIERVIVFGEGDGGVDFSVPETSYSTLVKRGSVGSFVTFIDGGFIVKHDGNDSTGAVVSNIQISAEDLYGNYTHTPVRVTYATHSLIGRLQELMDSGEVRNLCSSTLIRSSLPSLIDMSISFRGSSTAQEFQTRFVELLQTISRQSASEDESIRLEISNIIGALDEEGFSDFIDTDFEIRVTNFLSDGEYEVRYYNPSESTKRQMAIETPLAGGETSVFIKKLGPLSTPIQGRGKLFLGGNNPSTQEILPYEGVISTGDGVYEFILRGNVSVSHAHPEWESVFVTVRDYDPLMEMDALLVPAENHPYIRQLVVLKLV